MNLLVAWKKVLLFGLFGAVGCLAGSLVGEPYLYVAKKIAALMGATETPSLISKPVPPSPKAPPPPSEFRDRLSAAGAKTGDVQISLIWFNTNDLDLHCIDPSGFEIYWKPEHRRSATGGELDVDRNAGCNRLTAEPVENIYWAKGTAPMGRYRVYLDFYQRCAGAPNETTYKINVLHGGERKEFSGTISREDTAGGGPGRLIYEFQLEPKLELFVPTEFEIAPGTKSLKVPFAVRREFYQGKVEVKAENLPEHVTADRVTLEPNQSSGELTFKAADSAVTGKSKFKFIAAGESVSTSADPQLTIAQSAQFSLWVVIAIGIWTALLAAGLSAALLAGQNRYLGKTLFAPGRVPLVLVVIGAAAAGFISGSIGQALFFAFLLIGVAKLGLVFGWMLLGVLLGWGVSFFIPNLDGKKAALAGLAGGLLGGLTFWILSYAADVIGRFGGAALLGFCIGLMVAVVEAAFRRAWLEVRFSEREVITVNLGPEPVKVGGDARACTIWARGAEPIALRYWIRDGKVLCEDAATKRAAAVADGDRRSAGNVTVVVRTASAHGPTGSAPPPAPARPALPVPPMPPAASVDDALELPAQPVPPPAPAVVAAPAAKSAPPEYDDGLPAPLSPPPARAAARSILDADDLPAAPVRPVAPPPAAKPPAPAQKPPAPAMTPAAPVAKSAEGVQKPAPPAQKPPTPKPPVPAPTAAKPPASPVPKPPVPPVVKSPAAAAPAISANPGVEACPGCGRKVPGKPGERYCMVCDRTF